MILTLGILIHDRVWAEEEGSSKMEPRVLGAKLSVNISTNFSLIIDGREAASGTNMNMELPLGTHVFEVKASTSNAKMPATIALDGDWGVGAWVWDHKTMDKQTVRLWRAFQIPAGVKVTKAKLAITADNGYRLFLDGRELGKGSDLRHITEYDLIYLLPPGKHVLAVEGFNDDRDAGVLAGLKIDLTDGHKIEIPSDESWRIIPADVRDWQNQGVAAPGWPQAKIIGRFQCSPWAYAPAGITRLPPIYPVELHFWNAGWFQIVLIVISGFLVLVTLHLMSRLAFQAKARRQLERERSRIARDIHDELGAGVTQLLLLGEVARKEAAQATGQSGIERLCVKARNLANTVDEIVWAVNSRHDSLPAFARHTCKYAQAFFASSPLRCRLDVDAEIPDRPFALPVRRNLFLAVKEALNNAAKHSDATELFLRIHCQTETLVVTVEDNGRGFDPAQINTERNGLTNLARRMEEIGGACRVDSQPGRGCRVFLTVPLTQIHSRLYRWFRGMGGGTPAGPESKLSNA